MKQTTITTRAVVIEGQVFAVSDDAEWVAVDANGDVCQYVTILQPSIGGWGGVYIGHLCNIGPQPGWREMKLKLKDA